MKILILNGPNLSRLDLREQKYYGEMDYAQLQAAIKLPVIFNPAAFTHYSYAIRDAVSMLTAPAIEVHLSNPLSREEFRHTSVISGVVQGTIAGCGVDSYHVALIAMQKIIY